MCCFLSVSWGLLSDIDIESERLRMIGEARFTVWAVARVLRNLLNSFYYIEYTYINLINIEPSQVFALTKLPYLTCQLVSTPIVI